MHRLDVLSDYVLGCLIAAVVLYGLGSAVLEQLPEPYVDEPCSCGSQPDCTRKVYQVDEDRRAFVATYAPRQHCIYVEASPP